MKDDRLYLIHIQEAIERIEEYTSYLHLNHAGDPDVERSGCIALKLNTVSCLLKNSADLKSTEFVN